MSVSELKILSFLLFTAVKKIAGLSQLVSNILSVWKIFKYMEEEEKEEV